MMDKDRLPARDAEYFEQEIKRRERDLGFGWHVALGFVLLLIVSVHIVLRVKNLFSHRSGPHWIQSHVPGM